MEVPDFMTTANSYLQKETQRLANYRERKDEVWDILMDEVILKTSETLVNNPQSGLLKMLTSKNLEEAQFLYEFLDKATVDLSNFTAFFLTFIK